MKYGQRKLALAMAAISCAIVTSPLLAAPSSSHVTGQARDKAANILDFDDLVSSLEDIRDYEGFASIMVDPGARRVNVYWSGPVPNEVGRFRTSAADVAVELTISEAPFTKAELSAAADEVKESARESGVQLSAIFFAPDASGLTVEVNSEGRSSGARGQSADNLAVDSNVPISYETGGDALPRARNDMVAPFKGGGVLLARQGNGTTAVCTAGFTVLKNGVGHLLSAGIAPLGEIPTGFGTEIKVSPSPTGRAM
ncbi:hypothetical protein [Nocardioides marmotae]|uniref:hypothetical protein n=1 Tax=Nocardioides marmotae TaxID=2663857 RepID=UPI0012B552FD|nr:hypothetical protein [Nocardioides marmotae]MBC9734033.1 hypothetical protein [Nocardioides marmotae]MTB85136.1 hypothetical protein [Nocardioides marmotae]